MPLDEDYFNKEGYIAPRQLPDGRWIGLQRMCYTTGLFVGLDETGWSYRYCYERFSEALADLVLWDGNGDPPGLWIKHKPSGRMNPRWLAEAKQEMKHG